MDLDNLKFPIGKFHYSGASTREERSTWTADIAALPDQLEEVLASFSPEEIETPYRPEGWCAREVVHHLADSHMNAVVRLKLALTEENPIVKPYAEARWALLSDTQELPLDASLSMLKGMHLKWAHLLNSLSPADWSRTYYHPEQKKEVSLDELVALYAWHGKHHLGHIKLVKG